MLEHGEADERVPISQGHELYNALKLRGISVRMIRLPAPTPWPDRAEDARQGGAVERGVDREMDSAVAAFSAFHKVALDK